MRTFFLSILVLVGWLGMSSAQADIMGKPDVADGNTIIIAGEAVRLYGIDAPELAQTCSDAHGKVWACGKESMYALLRFLENHWVTCKEGRRDRSGFRSMVCFAGPYDIGAKMVHDGWALALDQERADYLLQQHNAMTAKRGIWQGGFLKPWEWRRAVRRQR
jgi:endonuclease YncB( thermonuclease family)